MIEARMNRRALALMVGIALLSGCKMIPRGPGTTPPPEDGPGEGLPADKARHRVALLVPLSGPNGAVGQSIANATTMAILDTNAQTVRITTYDTAGGPAAAATKAMQDGNRLILGPLLSDELPAVATVARAAKVPLITYANDPRLAARDVFVLGATPDAAIERVVTYARSRGLVRFAALAPKTEAGTRALATFGEVVRASGGTLVATDSYERGNNSVLSAAARLKAKGGYQAVLIADSARAAGQAAARLKPGGGASPRILGTEQWSGDAAASTTPALRGAWFAALSDARYRQFSASYQARFGAAPYRLATLGYDSVLLTVRIARDWRGNTPFPLIRLIDAGGFLGLDGPFRFSATGLGERALEVRETRAGGVTIVSPAPEKFVD